MNTEEKSAMFDPMREIKDPLPPDRHILRPIIITAIALLLLLLWAYFSNGCINTDSGSGDGSGSGSFKTGEGPGSGDSGDGPGSGDSGADAGKTQAPQKSGIGTLNAAPGSAAAQKGAVSSAAGSNPRPSPIELPKSDVEVFAQSPQPTAPVIDPDQGGAASGRKGFYGLEVASRGKVLFLIDVSGSMSGSSSEFPGQSRLEVLKMELKKSIFGGQDLTKKSLRRSGGFMIIAFSSSLKKFPDDKNTVCRYRNLKDMEKAKDFIDQLQPGGGTMMKMGWTEAIKLAGNEIDTIYFLTDGQPGDSFNAEWLLPQLRKTLPRVKVNCISIGSDNSFMPAIAKERKGKYIFLP